MYKAITYLQRPEVLYAIGATNKYVSLTPGTSSLGNNEILIKKIINNPLLLVLYNFVYSITTYHLSLSTKKIDECIYKVRLETNAC